MWRSARRLEADVARWRAAGWVTADGEAAIRAELRAGAMVLSTATVFGTLGAVLFAFAAMSFVAANWDAMSKLARLALLIGAMLAAYGLAAVLFARDMPGFGHAAALLAVGLFGADIMLIAQMYHIHGHPPDAVLVWGVGAFAAGVLIGSNPALVLALLLACLWSALESGTRAEYVGLGSRTVSLVHWPVLGALAVIGATFAWRRHRPGLELVALTTTGWVVLLGYLLAGGPRHGVVVAIGGGVTVAAAGIAHLVPPRLDPARAGLVQVIAARAVVYGAIATFAGLYAGQFLHADASAPFGVWAAGLLALSVVGIWYGLATASRSLVALAYVAFAVEVVTVYFKTVGSLLGSAGFFLSAGVVMVGLAALALRLERATRATAPPTSEAAP